MKRSLNLLIFFAGLCSARADTAEEPHATMKKVALASFSFEGADPTGSVTSSTRLSVPKEEASDPAAVVMRPVQMGPDFGTVI